MYIHEWLQAGHCDAPGTMSAVSIAFLAISDQYATFVFWTFFHKMAAGGHFG